MTASLSKVGVGAVTTVGSSQSEVTMTEIVLTDFSFSADWS